MDIDISDWPDWAFYSARFVCFFIGCTVQSNNILKTPTTEEALNDAVINMFPGGLAMARESKALTRAGQTLISRARAKLRGEIVDNVRPIVNRMPGDSVVYDSSTGQGLYVLVKDGKVVYVGRGNAPSRITDHKSDHLAGLWDEHFIVANNNLTYEEARGLEQLLIEHYGGPSNWGGTLLNKDRGLRYSHDYFDNYVDAAASLYNEAVNRVEGFLKPTLE
jgi:hypothetical protein